MNVGQKPIKIAEYSMKNSERRIQRIQITKFLLIQSKCFKIVT